MTASMRNDADPTAWRHARGKWFAAAVGWMSGRRRIVPGACNLTHFDGCRSSEKGLSSRNMPVPIQVPAPLQRPRGPSTTNLGCNAPSLQVPVPAAKRRV